MENGDESFLTVECAEDERSESEGRFGEAEPVGICRGEAEPA